jgi:hypothetical protein
MVPLATSSAAERAAFLIRRRAEHAFDIKRGGSAKVADQTQIKLYNIC